MAVEAIGSTGSGTPSARTELQRIQQKLADDLAAKAAEKVAAKDKAVLTRTEEDSLKERQTTSKTLDIGQLGSSLDLII